MQCGAARHLEDVGTSQALSVSNINSVAGQLSDPGRFEMSHTAY